MQLIVHSVLPPLGHFSVFISLKGHVLALFPCLSPQMLYGKSHKNGGNKLPCSTTVYICIPLQEMEGALGIGTFDEIEKALGLTLDDLELTHL